MEIDYKKLTIGNYIEVDGEIKQIIGIVDNRIIYDNGSAVFSKVHPIDLSDEIFESNDFRLLVDDTYTYMGFKIHRDLSGHFNFDICGINKAIRHVHELQNLLKIAGFEDKANYFNFEYKPTEQIVAMMLMKKHDPKSYIDKYNLWDDSSSLSINIIKFVHEMNKQEKLAELYNELKC